MEPVRFERHCATCPHWQIDRAAGGSTPTNHAGQCRRKPPTRDGWPMVASDDWCGEHPDRKGIVMIGGKFVALVDALTAERLQEIAEDRYYPPIDESATESEVIVGPVESNR